MICLGNITISFNTAAVSAVIPVMSLDLGISDFLAARVITYYLVPYGIGALIYAPLARFLTYRQILTVSFFCFGITALWAGLSQSLNVLLMTRVAMGLTAASAIPLGLMIIGDFAEKQMRGRLVGVFFSCSFFSSLAGIILSGVASWRWLFLIPSMLAFISSVCFLILGKKLLCRVHSVDVNYITIFKKREIQKVFAFIFVISFLYHGVSKWFGVYLSDEYQLNQYAITIFYMVMLFGSLIGQLVGGVLSDNRGRHVSLLIGIVGLSFATMALFKMYPLIILGMILTTIAMCWTVGHNGVSTILTDFADEDRPAIASLNSSVRFISGGLGFYVSSFFVKQSFGLTFLGIGVLMLVLGVLAPRVIPKG